MMSEHYCPHGRPGAHHAATDEKRDGFPGLLGDSLHVGTKFRRQRHGELIPARHQGAC
jgi:hypothetical protein